MLAGTLSNLPIVERFDTYRVAPSTNDLARAITAFPGQGIFVIQADRQTAGRGRSGAPYFSGEGGLWATIVAPLPSLVDHFSHNRALSLAIAEAAEETAGIPASSIAVKWPNDLYLAGKKVCGILLENHPVRSDLLIMGFGLNVNIAPTDFPAELGGCATSLSMETGRPVSRSRLLEAIIGRYRANLAVESSLAHASYLRRLYRRGDRAEVERRQGIVEGVEPDGRLRLRCGHELLFFVSGHVRFIDTREDIVR
jgi:BirA family biotin operon repressor/biotin-[acetyl-CoA-carboxylase] ligase